MSLIGIVIVFLAPCGASEKPWQDEKAEFDFLQLEELDGRVTSDVFASSLRTTDPLGLLSPYLAVNDEAVSVRRGVGDDLILVTVEFRPRGFSVPARSGGLVGLRVLVDPGHFGGAWSEIEGRHQALDDREPVREGDLTFATARLLSKRLHDAGAKTFLTRGPPPTQPFPEQIDDGFDPEWEAALAMGEQIHSSPYSLWRFLYPSVLARYFFQRRGQQLVQEELFGLYRRFDLRRRAAMAEEHRVDLTVSLHFNTSGLEKRNRLVVFVPGNLLPDETDTLAERYWAVRRTLDGTLPPSVDLAAHIGRAMRQHLNVEFVNADRVNQNPLPKLRPVDPKNGVYARNLAMLKRTSGVVVLVEGPCVDHPAEFDRLQDRSVWIDGRLYPERVLDYSDAVFEGIRRWRGGAENDEPL